jgi:outer membrane protein OmpA-like peptidoglycan-associated protein
MKGSFKIVCLGFLILFKVAAVSAWAEGGAGSTTANFLKIGMGARAAGMGDAFMSVADDSLAVFWNPAGLMLTRGTDISLTHQVWMMGVHQEYLTFSSRHGDEGAFGASLNYLGIKPYASTLETATGDYGGTGDEVSAHEFALSMAYAQRLGFWFPGRILNKLLIGIKATMVNQHLETSGATGASFDFGGMYELKRRRTYLAITVTNFGTHLAGVSQPLAATVGASHKLRKILFKKDSLTFAFAIPIYNDTGARFNIGTEYTARFGEAEASLRGGYRSGYDLNGTSGICVGAGVLKHYPTFDVGLDYALAPYGELGLTHRITLKARLGGGLVGPEPILDAPADYTVGAVSEPMTMKLNYSSEEGVQKWKVSIADLQNRPVTVFEGKGNPPSRLTWNGQRGDGTSVPTGSYRIDCKLEDSEDQIGWATPRLVKFTRVRIPPKTSYQYGFSFSGDLMFDSGLSILKPAGYEAIAKAVAVIQQRYPEAKIIISGHTDNVRLNKTAAYKDNEELSLARANAIKDYLVKNGFDAGRLEVQGYGDKKPISPNTTAEGRAKNRRVDLTLTGERTLTIDDLLSEVATMMKSGQFDTALQQLDKAMELEVDNATVYKLKGNCHWRLGQKDLAMECFRRALLLDPKDTTLATWVAGQGGPAQAPPPTPTPSIGLPALP